MKIYKASEYKLLSNEERNQLGRLILHARFPKRTIIEGIKYLETMNTNTGEKVVIDQEIEEELEISMRETLQEFAIKREIEPMCITFEILINRFPNNEKMHQFFESIDKDMFKQLYIRFHNEMRISGMEVKSYIDLEGLYQQFITQISQLLKDDKDEEISKTQLKEKAEVINGIKKDLARDIDEKGGLETWIDSKIKNNGNLHTAYTKDRLIEAVLSNKVSNEKKEKYARLLVKAGLTPKDIMELISIGEMTPQRLRDMYYLQPLRKIVKNTVARMGLDNIIMSFIVIRDRELLRGISWSKVNVHELKRIINEYDEVLATDIVEFLVHMYQLTNNRFTEQEIDTLLQGKKTNHIDMLRAYFELAKAGMYSEDKIITLFGEEVESENTEDPYEESEEKYVSIKELLEFFSTEMVIERLRELTAKNDEETIIRKMHFTSFYYALLDANRIEGDNSTELIQQELKDKLRISINDGNAQDLLIAIHLFASEILTLHHMQEILRNDNEEQIIDLYEKGLDDTKVLILYKLGLLSNEMIELLYQEITSEEIEAKIESKEIRDEDVALLYFLGIIDIDQIGKKQLNNVKWNELFNISNITDMASKIAKLYRNGNIGFEEVKQLKELQIIGAKEAEAILNQLDIGSILMRGLTSEEGECNKVKRVGIGGSKRKESITLDDRNELLKNLGFEPVVNVYGQILVVASGSFKGYRVYRDTNKNFGVIIFENETEGSSFIMHEAKAGEFIMTQSAQATLVGSRSIWREKARVDGSVTAKLHSLHWARNIIGAIVETSSTFKFDDEEERRKYVKTETQRLCEEHKDSIEYLRLIKEEQVAK